MPQSDANDPAAERRRIAVLTTGRQDYGILRSTLLALRDDPATELLVYAGGMHLLPRFGRTIDAVRADGYASIRELDFVSEPPEPAGDASRALAVVAQALEDDRPDALLMVGDRSETLAAGLAATLRSVPIVHLHGGEETEGAVDNAIRHAVTKLASLHFVTHEAHAARVRQLGEPPETVIVAGAAGLDNLYRTDLPDLDALSAHLGMPLSAPLVVVTVHPTTLASDGPNEVTAIADAMAAVPATYVVTLPNADAGGVEIRAFWERWAAGRPNVKLVDALGEMRYWALLRHADAVLGNSSSGIIEAPAAGVPVVNVGDRQLGRLRPASVRDVPVDSTVIEAALRDAVRPESRAEAARTPPLFPAGPAAPRILAGLHAWRVPVPPRKRFNDLI